MRLYLKRINWRILAQNSLLILLGYLLNMHIYNISMPNVAYWTVYSLVVLFCSCYLSRTLNSYFVVKLIISYASYSIVSYLVDAARNLNNGDFKFWNLIENQFLQVDFLPTIAIVLGISLIVSYISEGTSIPMYLDKYIDNTKENFVLSLFASSILISDSRWIFWWTNQADIDFSTLIFSSFTIWLVFICLSYLFFNSIDSIRANKATFSLSFSVSIILAVVFNYTFQAGVYEHGELLGRYIFPGATLYQICILALICILTFLLINRFIPAVLLLISLGTILSIVNSLKEVMRSEPLLLTDFVWLHDIAFLSSFLNRQTILLILAVICLPITFWWITKDRLFRGTILKSKKLQGSIFLVICSIFLGVFITFASEENGQIKKNVPIITTLNNWYNINWMGFETNARYKSLMYVWTKQLTTDIMERPKEYSQQRINQIASTYTAVAEKLNMTRSESISDQTVIYILSESLSNPNRVDGVQLTQNVLKNIDDIKSQTTSGLMRSDGYGGGTANMEFQTLTGLPFYNFSSSVSSIYTEVVPKMSVLPSISDSFEANNRLVLHPSGANNYGRKNVYRRLGFSKLIFATDSDNTFSSVTKKGVSISDETVYDNILKELDISKNQFFSVITMQNHAPWSVGEPVDVVAYNDTFTKEENGALTEYARLASYTDRYTKEFLDKLSQIDKRITVVFYGDHLPGLYPAAVFIKNPDSQYRTDYFIWSNYNSQQKLDYPVVGSSDFTAELLEHTNSKVSPYYALLTQILQQATINEDNLSNEQKQIADDLRLIQYDITLGKNYISQHPNFFKLGE